MLREAKRAPEQQKVLQTVLPMAGKHHTGQAAKSRCNSASATLLLSILDLVRAEELPS